MPSEATKARFASLAGVVTATSARDRWLLLTHDNPDPDALASTAALALILRRRFRRRATIAYGGMIGRAENREMVRALRLDLSHLRHLNRRNYQHFALIDCQPWTGNSQLPSEVVPDLVFDHHPMRKATQRSRFFDVRPEYGATATILTEYLEEAGLHVTRPLATGLVYAIRSETQDFGREAAGPDHAAYDRLLPRIDRRTLARIQTAPLPSPTSTTSGAPRGPAGGNLWSPTSAASTNPTSCPRSLTAAAHGVANLVDCTGSTRSRLPLDPDLESARRRRQPDAPPDRPTRQGRRARHHGGRLRRGSAHRQRRRARARALPRRALRGGAEEEP
jgi:hypothetical protein